ncbi:MAG: TonB system transport protein ExbD [Cereibacter sphaeroides]|uniref:Biopolymer transport protein ExbD n=1 Tax=Cereibacter sphaeroides TaxID=1063 RepID=A0A2W5SL99_CERSP|nr:MAG: TonB system transport protein ExbD [Cereibacter sphaeroides]
MAGGIRENSGDDLEENHEINVTPFIDVMLVLLIIFMVAAPLSTVDVPVDLPGSNANQSERPPEPIYLTLQRDLTLSVAEETVPREALAAKLEALTNGDRDTRIYLRADEAVPYGNLMEVMNLLRGSGFLKFALVGIEAVPGGIPLPGVAPTTTP